jgi:hypothetical protein
MAVLSYRYNRWMLDDKDGITSHAFPAEFHQAPLPFEATFKLDPAKPENPAEVFCSC